MSRRALACAFAALLSSSACSFERHAATPCHPDEHAYDSMDCACQGPCKPGYLCVDGACCNPADHETDEDNCGCGGPVPPGSFCVGGVPCNPDLHRDDPANCACQGPCADNERCQIGECRCDEALNQDNDQDCGCNGPCLPPGLFGCVAGACTCLPLANLWNDAMCACDEACELDEVCVQGTCVCGEGFIRCEDECVPGQEETGCPCVAQNHAFDTDNCNCQGPCPDGERCFNGDCICDPLQHLEDSANCACVACCDGGGAGGCPSPDELDVPPPGNVPGEVSVMVCQFGTCQCAPDHILCEEECVPETEGCGFCDPQQHLFDNGSCACAHACAPGEYCWFGACKCDPLQHLEDSAACACGNPCTDGRVCTGGVCVCPPGTEWCDGQCVAPDGPPCCHASLHQSDVDNCDCKGPCPLGDLCASGQCICDSTQHTNDSSACGCPPVACASNELCVTGKCVVPL